ncbi:MAG: LamG-like jellyroll fold domain-containing protein [Saprospiraceae bacterium]
MKKLFFVLNYLLFFAISTYAQTAESKLAANYCFDDCNNLKGDCSGKFALAQVSPTAPICVCGVNGSAIRLSGDEYLNLVDVSYKFNTSNFSVSFYFKPFGLVGVREIITNRDSCTKNRIFSISYNASAQLVTVLMKDEKRSVTLTGKIDDDVCWQHVVLTRESNYQRLFINGKIKSAAYSPDNQRVNLTSKSILSIGKSACHPAIPGGQFRGLIDDVRIYENFALKEEEVKQLYIRPDRIKTNDQLLFLGTGVKTEIQSACANKFNWSPAQGVANVNVGSTTITPEKAGIFSYILRFNDSVSSCTAYDTLRITVVDPQTQPCGEVFMPNAFTPNNDDNNEYFGISNPYTVGKLIEFEILDRWGGTVFRTDDPFVQWDGKVRGSLVMPGEYLYRIKYNCEGTEKNKIGSFVLIL